MTTTSPAPHPGRALLLTFICVGIFMVYLDATIVNVALPTMQQKLGADITQLQWIVDAYALVVASLLLTAGTLGDILGRKNIFLGGLIGFVTASALCAVAPNYTFLLVARILQGAAGSVMIPISLALISGLFPAPADRAKAVGVWAGVGGLALATGPVLGGYLVAQFGWQSIFWVNVPVGALALSVLIVRLPSAQLPGTRRPDVAGQLLFILAISSLAYGLIEASSKGWGSGIILTAFAVAAVALGAFVAWESRSADPMLPLGLFRNPVLIVAGTVNFLGLFGLYGSIFLLTLYLQQINGLSTLQAGLRFLSLNVAIMVFSYVASMLAAKFGPKIPIVIGSVASTAGLLQLTQLQPGTGYGSYWWAMSLIGAGVSLVGAPATVALLGSVRPEQTGTASGVSNTFRQVGSVFGVALCGTLLAQHLSSGIPKAVAPLPLEPAQRAALTNALAKGDLAAVSHLSPAAREIVLRAAAPVFTDGLHMGAVVAAAATLVGGLFALFVLPSRKKPAAAAGVPSAAKDSAPQTTTR
ncbi:EmrB/QacA subfamily drug resistance transporter [Kitasatospora sp. MAA4]|uniref:DHA2 family efflux MFS transporter permease subunit n=1 Tax=Kitasatospora sp. MAA4 TaxID=3035093 RepID=UPI00247467AE|nr:DHA2 family efflux MFS transporter permease subunit [Kitasatospora sp. MAA4]MDH6131846.1 EmrB/QacA subfamily drug resistance transporter [Kitasatospora sp. MAA4]